ncbi:MAG: thioredoxin domain-containing protein [Spirochaetes bacterium]|nr:MAG: thioredoxin domain-containing protein [Spirochaetota bacterium]
MHEDTIHENRLINETSPYLLQHAHNPVDWHPWGDEAFARAQREDRPIFLSIGYSTCHWCHVMERESFESREVAEMLNRAFVCVKVDREERPDVDRLYMDFCQALTGSGGWPLTIVMTPGKKPFFAATYIPRVSGHGRVGLLELVPRIETIWRSDRRQVEESADEISATLLRFAGSDTHTRGDASGPDPEQAVQTLHEEYDSLHGGFGMAVKFPTAHVLVFLIRYWRRTGDTRARRMAADTLRAMRRGGIWDHAGGGFHRYSTDREWRLPHFEKMLYDQAALAGAYLEASRAFGDASFAETAREIFAYVLRDLASPAGPFCAAEDADSEGIEGRFYLWTHDEVAGVLGPERARLFARAFGVFPEGNYRDEATAVATGDNILVLEKNAEELAAGTALDPRALARDLAEMLAALRDARSRRERPLLDDKLLTDWNGMMIGAMARGARVLGDASLAAAARKAADFFLASRRTADGGLVHLGEGSRAIRGMADDYAFFIRGLVELYETTFVARYLGEALKLARYFIARFLDEEGTAFYSTEKEGSVDLLFRRRDVMDAAVPSANSAAIEGLFRLARLTGLAGLEETAARIAGSYQAGLARHPSACTGMLAARELARASSCEIVITGDPGAPVTRAFIDAAGEVYLPHAAVLLQGPSGGEHDLAGIVEGIGNFTPPAHGAIAYVCAHFTCRNPVTDPGELSALLRELSGGADGS